MDQNQIQPMMKQMTENLKKKISELFSAQAVKQLAMSDAVQDLSKNDSNANGKEPVDCLDTVDNIRVVPELVLELTDERNSNYSFTESIPESVASTWLQELDLVCSAPTFLHNSAIGCKQDIVMKALTLSWGFARRATAPLYKYSSECKVWKPGLYSA